MIRIEEQMSYVVNVERWTFARALIASLWHKCIASRPTAVRSPAVFQECRVWSVVWCVQTEWALSRMHAFAALCAQGYPTALLVDTVRQVCGVQPLRSQLLWVSESLRLSLLLCCDAVMLWPASRRGRWLSVALSPTSVTLLCYSNTSILSFFFLLSFILWLLLHTSTLFIFIIFHLDHFLLHHLFAHFTLIGYTNYGQS